jgi:acyl carrier protein
MSFMNLNLQTQSTNTAKLIQDWLIDQIAEQLQMDCDQVSIKESFDSYGLNSSQALIIAAKAEKKFGFKLSPVLLWHYPNIESLSHRLVEEFSATEQVFEI